MSERLRFDFNGSQYELPDGMIKNIQHIGPDYFSISGCGSVGVDRTNETVVICLSRNDFVPDEARALAYSLLMCADRAQFEETER